jgi:hypothetical protein
MFLCQVDRTALNKRLRAGEYYESELHKSKISKKTLKNYFVAWCIHYAAKKWYI